MIFPDVFISSDSRVTSRLDSRGFKDSELALTAETALNHLFQRDSLLRLACAVNTPYYARTEVSYIPGRRLDSYYKVVFLMSESPIPSPSCANNNPSINSYYYFEAISTLSTQFSIGLSSQTVRDATFSSSARYNRDNDAPNGRSFFPGHHAGTICFSLAQRAILFGNADHSAPPSPDVTIQDEMTLLKLDLNDAEKRDSLTVGCLINVSQGFVQFTCDGKLLPPIIYFENKDGGAGTELFFSSVPPRPHDGTLHSGTQAGWNPAAGAPVLFPTVAIFGAVPARPRSITITVVKERYIDWLVGENLDCKESIFAFGLLRYFCEKESECLQGMASLILNGPSNEQQHSDAGVEYALIKTISGAFAFDPFLRLDSDEVEPNDSQQCFFDPNLLMLNFIKRHLSLRGYTETVAAIEAEQADLGYYFPNGPVAPDRAAVGEEGASASRSAQCIIASLMERAYAMLFPEAGAMTDVDYTGSDDLPGKCAAPIDCLRWVRRTLCLTLQVRHGTSGEGPGGNCTSYSLMPSTADDTGARPNSLHLAWGAITFQARPDLVYLFFFLQFVQDILSERAGANHASHNASDANILLSWPLFSMDGRPNSALCSLRSQVLALINGRHDDGPGNTPITAPRSAPPLEERSRAVSLLSILGDALECYRNRPYVFDSPPERAPVAAIDSNKTTSSSFESDVLADPHYVMDPNRHNRRIHLQQVVIDCRPDISAPHCQSPIKANEESSERYHISSVNNTDPFCPEAGKIYHEFFKHLASLYHRALVAAWHALVNALENTYDDICLLLDCECYSLCKEKRAEDVPSQTVSLSVVPPPSLTTLWEQTLTFARLNATKQGDTLSACYPSLLYSLFEEATERHDEENQWSCPESNIFLASDKVTVEELIARTKPADSHDGALTSDRPIKASTGKLDGCLKECLFSFYDIVHGALNRK